MNVQAIASYIQIKLIVATVVAKWDIPRDSGNWTSCEVVKKYAGKTHLAMQCFRFQLATL